MKKIFTYFLIIISFAHNAYSLEISSSDTKLLLDQINKLKTGDVIITDVSGVLFYKTDAILSPHNKHVYKKFLAQIEEKKGTNIADFLRSIVIQSSVKKPVDSEYITAMNEAIKRGVDVLVITFGRTGALGTIHSRDDLRLSILDQIGFKTSVDVEHKTYILDNLESFKEGKPSIYKNGVIFTNRNDKGLSFIAFMDKAHYKPKKILFVDNSKKQIDSMKKACEAMGIDFTGFLYTKIYEITKRQYDQKIVNKQLEYLEKKMLWLSDEQAHCMILHHDDAKICFVKLEAVK